MQNGPGENPRQEAERGAKEAVEEVSPWVARLARFGYVTKGVMYVVVGLLAVLRRPPGPAGAPPACGVLSR